MRAHDVRADNFILSTSANDLRNAFSFLFSLRSIIIRKRSSVNVNIRRAELPAHRS